MIFETRLSSKSLFTNWTLSTRVSGDWSNVKRFAWTALMWWFSWDLSSNFKLQVSYWNSFILVRFISIWILKSLIRPQSPKRKVEKVVTCLICNKTFARKTNLKNHIELVHEKLKRVACNVCGFKFGHIGDLRVHINIVHNKILRFECGKCDRKCVSKNDLKKHVANVHEKPKEAVIDCGLCEEKFVSKAEAERHRRSVHDTRKYACTLCRKKLVKNKFKCTR